MSLIFLRITVVTELDQKAHLASFSSDPLFAALLDVCPLLPLYKNHNNMMKS
jgi:hypothetical protein